MERMDTDSKKPEHIRTDGVIECKRCGELFESRNAYKAHHLNGEDGACAPTYAYGNAFRKTRRGNWDLTTATEE